ncbi:hypothetical protein GPECTOR_6g783 [Gonium pectorale]|uniref:Uncharacterized protein n=1 Tax=Gonium pectorale TaxID=33097 RepID=A0A150GVL4_GONPE|nr:hypothetical protein GPECTOR_6g783 [Gonium pectorale]|eukprot:KXZ53865.1 hypothetical protein GPECTOR_6g783 [Gonium pectorale]
MQDPGATPAVGTHLRSHASPDGMDPQPGVHGGGSAVGLAAGATGALTGAAVGGAVASETSDTNTGRVEAPGYPAPEDDPRVADQPVIEVAPPPARGQEGGREK